MEYIDSRLTQYRMKSTKREKKGGFFILFLSFFFSFFVFFVSIFPRATPYCDSFPQGNTIHNII